MAKVLTSEEENQLLQFFPNGVIAIDFETTGLSPLSDNIIEVAAVKLKPNKECETFHTLVNPEREIPPYTIKIHQITDEMVKNSPTMGQTIDGFVDFLEDLPLIAHNAQFDMGFLIKECHHFEKDLGKRDIFDSCHMGRSVFKKKEKSPENFKLSGLAEFFQIPLNHHRALDDSFACLRIFSNCLGLVEAEKRNEFVRSRAFIFNTKTIKTPGNYQVKKELKLLIEKIPTQEHLNITYSGGTQGNSPRPVRPIGIIPQPKGLVLYAECLLTKVHKSFHLQKIKKVELLEKK